MNRAKSLTGRSTGQLAAALSAATMALGAAVAGLAWAVPAQAARASAVTVASPSLIAVNTLNWSGSAGFGSRAPAWYKDNSGVIHLQGAATQTSASGPRASLIATLPAAARPANSLHFVVHTLDGTYAGLAIAPGGQIVLTGPLPPAVKDFAFVSLEGITYRPSLAGSKIAVNTLNWSGSAGFGSRAPAWYKDNSGVIHLQGAATQTSASGPRASLLATLPAAARPANSLYFVVDTRNGTYADLAILPSGQIALIAPRPPAEEGFSFVSLEGIIYRPKPSPLVITTIGPDWSPFAGFGSRVPAWFTDKPGLIHLQGAARQTSTTSSTPNLIAILPAAARPAHSLYFVVHTFNGTYADLAILPGGQIAVIDPRPPAVKDYAFVSLEGISYQR